MYIFVAQGKTGHIIGTSGTKIRELNEVMWPEKRVIVEEDPLYAYKEHFVSLLSPDVEKLALKLIPEEREGLSFIGTMNYAFWKHASSIGKEKRAWKDILSDIVSVQQILEKEEIAHDNNVWTQNLLSLFQGIPPSSH